MKPLHSFIHGVLAAGALLVAYTTWQRPMDTSPGEVRVLDLGKDALKSVRFEDSETKQFVDLSADPADASALVRISQRPSQPGKPDTPERLVRGDSNAAKLFKQFSSLSANRQLGVLPDERLKALGIAPPRRTLTLTLSTGATRVFQISPSPEGGTEPYLRDSQSGVVYTVPRTLLADFESAPIRLVEKRLHSFALDTIDRLKISAGGKQREAVVKRGADGAIVLAFAETPDAADGELKKAHDRVFNAWGQDILGKDETPQGGAPVMAIRIEYFKKGQVVGHLELFRSADVVSTDKQPPLYARSESALGFVSLAPDLASVIKELEGFLR